MWIFVLLALLTTPTPPPGQPVGTPTPTARPLPAVTGFRAVWDGARARVTWETKELLLCVGKHDIHGTWTWLGCSGGVWEDVTPAAHDRYVLMDGGTIIERADLRAVAHLPMVRR